MPTQINTLPDQNGAGTMEDMARRLEASGDYRVLRRLVPRALAPAEPASGKTGIIIDLETTGLDHTRDEVIELGMLKFTYSDDDAITNVSAVFQAFHQPSTPIPAEITELTGITDAMVAGHKIDAGEVDAFVAGANIIIAHNAAFDRKFAERFWPTFQHKSWACSMSELDWKTHGFSGTKLPYLLNENGLFHDAHRAADDCHALLEILARPLPGQNISAFANLLARARRMTFRIWAENSPYDLKNLLKARGYRWGDGSDGSLRSWYVDVLEEQRDAELEYLQAVIYQREIEILTRSFTARDRFSRRIQG